MEGYEVSSAAQIVIAVFAVITAYPLFQHLVHARRALNFNVYRDVLALMDLTAPHRKYLEEQVSLDLFDVSNMSAEEAAMMEELIRSWDKLGIMVLHGVVPRSLVMDHYSRSLVMSFRYLKPYVEEQRSKRNQISHRGNFYWLASKALSHRQKKYPGEPGLDIPVETLRQERRFLWSKWMW